MRSAAGPAQDRDMRRPRRATADRGDSRIGLGQRVARDNLDRGAVTLAERGGEFGKFRGAEKIGRRVDEVAHHPGGGGGRTAALLPLGRQQLRRAAFGRLQRSVAIGAEAKAESGNGRIVVARLQAPGRAFRQAERQVAERGGRRVVAETEHRADHAFIARQEQQLLRRRREVELAKEARLRRRQAVEERGKPGRTHGMQRPRRIGVVDQAIECLLQHRTRSHRHRRATAQRRSKQQRDASGKLRRIARQVALLHARQIEQRAGGIGDQRRRPAAFPPAPRSACAAD